MGLANWANFFMAEVGASAALAGLVTVAISINLSRILEIEHLPSRAGESLFSLTATFTLCGVALFPDISLGELGALALLLALLTLLFGLRNQWLWGRQVRWSEWRRQVVNAVCRLASTLPIAIGGVLLCDQAPEGLAWIAIGVVATLVVAVLNAWVLLVEIIR